MSMETNQGSAQYVMVAPNAGSHNSIYRGKNLGTAVTDEQYAAIAAGTFDDLFIGDYWVIDGVNYRIAAFNYYLHCGETEECTANHVVIVPDRALCDARMNPTSSTEGGYVGSEMYKEGLKPAIAMVKAAFSGHVLTHQLFLSTGTTNGHRSTGEWLDREVDLLCEHMVYGSGIFSPVSDGTLIPIYQVEKGQLPLFFFAPELIATRTSWWLRDVISATDFARICRYGLADYGDGSSARGIRPVFCIR